MLTSAKRGLRGKGLKAEEKKLQVKSSQLHALKLWITFIALKVNHPHGSLIRRMAKVKSFLDILLTISELLGKWHWLCSLHYSLLSSIFLKYKHLLLSEFVMFLNLDSRGCLFISWSSFSLSLPLFHLFHLVSCFSWCYHNFALGSFAKVATKLTCVL